METSSLWPARSSVGGEVPAAASPPGPAPLPGGGGPVAGLGAGAPHRHRHHRALPPLLVSVNRLPEQTDLLHRANLGSERQGQRRGSGPRKVAPIAGPAAGVRTDLGAAEAAAQVRAATAR